MMYPDALKPIEKQQGISNQPGEWIQIVWNKYYRPWAVDFDQIYWFLAIFGPEMKVYTGLVKYPDALKLIEHNKGYRIYQ